MTGASRYRWTVEELMYSSLISKIEKAKRYAEQPERITFERFDVRFRGDNGSHRVSLKGEDWACECDHFRTSGLCAHVMTMQRLFANHLAEGVRYTTEHPVLV